MDQIKAAILSFGMSGEIFHAPLLSAHSGFKLKTILERSKEKSKELYPDSKIVRTFEDVSEDPEIEMVIVNTPNPTHYEFTKKILESGKHVVVEKPFTNSTAEARDLIETARKNNKILSVFQNRRWDGDFKTVQKVIKNKLCGELVEFECHYDRFRNYVSEGSWKEEENEPGSGILYNLGSHMLDQVLVLFGMPKSITADIRSQRKGGRVADNYEVILDYGNIKATAKSSYMVREHGPRYMVYGREGTFLKYGIDPQEEALKIGDQPGGSGWGIEKEEDWGILNTEINGLHYYGQIETLPGNYMDYYTNIFEAIREDKPLAVPAEQGLQVIKVIEAAIESNREKKTIYLK